MPWEVKKAAGFILLTSLTLILAMMIDLGYEARMMNDEDAAQGFRRCAICAMAVFLGLLLVGIP